MITFFIILVSLIYSVGAGFAIGVQWVRKECIDVVEYVTAGYDNELKRINGQIVDLIEVLKQKDAKIEKLNDGVSNRQGWSH